MIFSTRIVSLLIISVIVLPTLYAHSKENKVVKKSNPERKIATNPKQRNEWIERVEDKFILSLEARKFAQGEVVLLRIKPKESKWLEENYKLIWMGKEIPLSKQKKSYIAFLPIPPEAKPGTTLLEIHSQILFVESGMKQYEIELAPTQFTVIKKHPIQLDNKYVTQELSPETLAFIQECVKLKESAYASNSSLLVSSKFSNPLDLLYITSPFYVRRDYNNQKGRPHGGVDFRGKTGTPIYAVMDGKVVLAKKMYYEGNFTIIDHGNKIFTLYMHQSELIASEGDLVKKGQMIGKIGSTGMSTGPHLHLGAKIAGITVNPISLLALTSIRETD